MAHNSLSDDFLEFFAAECVQKGVDVTMGRLAPIVPELVRLLRRESLPTHKKRKSHAKVPKKLMKNWFSGICERKKGEWPRILANIAQKRVEKTPQKNEKLAKKGSKKRKLKNKCPPKDLVELRKEAVDLLEAIRTVEDFPYEYMEEFAGRAILLLSYKLIDRSEKIQKTKKKGWEMFTTLKSGNCCTSALALLLYGWKNLWPVINCLIIYTALSVERDPWKLREVLFIAGEVKENQVEYPPIPQNLLQPIASYLGLTITSYFEESRWYKKNKKAEQDATGEPFIIETIGSGDNKLELIWADTSELGTHVYALLKQ